MHFRLPERREIRSMLSLAVPIAAMQIGLVLFGVVDTLFMGRLGVEAVAGVGLGGSTYFALFIFGLGILLGIDPLSSRAYGQGRREECAHIFIHAAAMAMAGFVPLLLLMRQAALFYKWIGVDPAVAEVAVEYLSVLQWMVLPGLLFVACRQYLQSMDITRALVGAIVAGNLVNIACNYAFVFGKFGFPALGVIGCASASLVSSFIMLVVGLWACAYEWRKISFRFKGWRPALFRDLISIGLPVGLQMLVEVSMFALVTTLMGRFGATAAASHQITVNMASLTFMIPLGISLAASVRVGQGLGRGRPGAAANSGNTALILGIGFMSCMSFMFWVMPGFLIRLYSADTSVVALGISFLRIAALFQVVDGMQAVLSGSLRGLGITRIPLLANVLGHAGLGLPLGYWLAFSYGLGPRGLWFGLLAGLGSVAMGLLFVWRKKTVELFEAAGAASQDKRSDEKAFADTN